MNNSLKLFVVLCCLVFATACDKPNSQAPLPGGQEEVTPDPQQPDEETDQPQKPDEPVKPDPAVYPEGLTVQELSYTHSDGRKTRYFLASIDFKKNPQLQFTVTLNQPKATPSQVYKNFDSDYGIPYVVTNAGYFAGATSVSPVFVNSFCSVIAPLSITWPNYEHPEADVYVTRAAIGQMKDGSMDIAWVYCCDPDSRTHYSFPCPWNNNEKTKTFMPDPPTTEVPGAQVWKPVWGIGGGPMLVMDGKDVAMDSYWKECLNSGGTAGSSHVPRTGAGLDKDGNLLLIVADGRGMKGSPGLTLPELAEVFISHGAIKAMNLDGGGSSAMIGKEGELLNWPSDTGSGSTAVQRKVTTCIAVSLLPSKK